MYIRTFLHLLSHSFVIHQPQLSLYPSLPHSSHLHAMCVPPDTADATAPGTHGPGRFPGRGHTSNSRGRRQLYPTAVPEPWPVPVPEPRQPVYASRQCRRPGQCPARCRGGQCRGRRQVYASRRCRRPGRCPARCRGGRRRGRRQVYASRQCRRPVACRYATRRLLSSTSLDLCLVRPTNRHSSS